MIWQLESGKIVMLTSLMEGTKVSGLSQHALWFNTLRIYMYLEVDVMILERYCSQCEFTEMLNI